MPTEQNRENVEASDVSASIEVPRPQRQEFEDREAPSAMTTFMIDI